MECPYCQAKNPDNARYCNNCGRELLLKCQNCGAPLVPGGRYCPTCGQPASQLSGDLQTSKPEEAEFGVDPGGRGQTSPGDILHHYVPKELLKKLEVARSSRMMVGERRIVTILFCDVQGSTEAASRLDPEEWAEIINGAFEHMIQPIYRYEGTVARLMGDGFLAFFGAPIAHEDDPHRAVLAGLEILQVIHEYGAEIKANWGIDFDVRIGINTGLVVVGAVGSDLRMEYSALGDAINIAARMEQTARPGSLQIAEATYNLVGLSFEVEPVRDLKIKGHEELRAYRVLGRRDVTASLRGIAGLSSPLVGRHKEMASLMSLLKDLLQGQGRLVFVTGEAGLGKSRLVSEFRQSVYASQEIKIMWMEGRSSSYDSSIPFALFSNLFRDTFRLRQSVSDTERYEQVSSWIESLVPGAGEEMAPFFATLLGITLDDETGDRVRYLEPVRLRSLIFEKVKALIEGVLSSSPAVLFLDDLHWADPTSLDLLETLLPMVTTKPFLVIAAFRPQKGAVWPFEESVARKHQQHIVKISLNALDEKHSRSLIANLLEIEDLPENVRYRILEKAEGNPFYIEEVIRSLMNRGLVIRKDGRWQAIHEIQDIALPDTLAGLITARLDRLDETTRYVLQAASVIGREFSLGTLGSMVDIPEQVEASLVELKRRELIQESGHSGGHAFHFKHVLTQDAAYTSILLSNRRELHERAANALMHANPAAYAEIARHLVEARQANRAVPYLVQAGEQAARAYAVVEAEAHFQQAIELLQGSRDNDLLRRAYEGLGKVYQFSNRFPEAIEAYTTMLKIAESIDDIPMQISAMNKLAGVAALALGDFQQAEQLLDQAEKMSRSHGELLSMPETSLLRCQMCTARAEFDQVIFYMDEVIKIGQESGERENILLGLEHVSYSLVFLARFDEALMKAEEALRLAREIGNKEHEANLLASPLPICYLRNGEFALAHECLEEAIRIAEKIGLLSAQGEAGYLLTEMARWKGEYENALKVGQKALNVILPLEPYMPFVIVPVLGSLGMVYLEISEEFKDQISIFHEHALQLLESPVGRLTGSAAWADLALCALQLNDLKVAEEAVYQGLNYPNMYMRLERPRHLAASALLALVRNEVDQAVQFAGEACAYAEERGMSYLYPFLYLTLGQVLAWRGDRSKGDLEAALESLGRAEAQARQLGMKPVLWQALAKAAGVLTAGGQVEQASQKLDQAAAVAAEVAGTFEDPVLRQAYLRNSFRKLGRSIESIT